MSAAASSAASAMLSSTPILESQVVSMCFGRFTALTDVSVAFHAGRLTAIIGPNGAGKSTYFNVLSGALAPTRGRVLFEGRDLTGSPQHAFARQGIAKSFQITNVFPHLSAHENVRIAAQMRHRRFELLKSRAHMSEFIDAADALLARVGLTRASNQPARDLAHGQQRCLEVAIALASEPRLLLMDEPTAGMSPEETRVMMDLIATLAAERTVILVEHKMKLVMGLCDRLIVLHHGELLAEGRPDEIRANEEVRRVYLGQGAT